MSGKRNEGLRCSFGYQLVQLSQRSLRAALADITLKLSHVGRARGWQGARLSSETHSALVLLWRLHSETIFAHSCKLKPSYIFSHPQERLGQPWWDAAIGGRGRGCGWDVPVPTLSTSGWGWRGQQENLSFCAEWRSCLPLPSLQD